jgi:transposase-like protein
MTIRNELIDELLAGHDPASVMRQDGLLGELKTALLNRLMAAEVAEWQSRRLEPLYPVMFFDAIRVKIRDQGTVSNKAVYLALGVTPDGRKHILGLWIDPNEGAKFWLRIVNELRNRGVKDILIAVVDGLKGFPEAINAAFPQTLVQTCIVHLLRNALAYVSWQDRRQVVAGLKHHSFKLTHIQRCGGSWHILGR